MNVDFDGDGIAERRRICAIGLTATTSCTTSRSTTSPFAVCSPILMPHRLIGRSSTT